MKRSSGVLLPLTSLPSGWGVGDLGPSAMSFVESLQAAKQSWWQVLPLTPVAAHGSPYSARSAFAGNPLLLSPEELVRQGFLNELPTVVSEADPRQVDYPAALAFKETVVQAAYRDGYQEARLEGEFVEFCSRNAAWLDDFALYDALRREQGKPWYEWPEEVRRREARALEEKKSLLRPAVERAVFAQYLFDLQWSSLLAECKQRGVRVLGDVPFYVFHDSADIWAHPDLFKVDQEGRPIFVGGVPPDAFSETGQRWGNPVYEWRKLEETGYTWWVDKMGKSLSLSDTLRLDHFRGYVAYWEIPGFEKTAVGGKWVEVPKTFLAELKKRFPSLPFVAEDLGVITSDVREAIKGLGIPGMKVLLFAFDGSPDNPYLPENHPRNSVVCTGTHDTNTVLGWFRDEAGAKGRETLSRYLGRSVSEQSVCAEFIGMALGSDSDVAVLPLQDILGLGSEARMNNPGRAEGNWRWRTLPGELSALTLQRLGEETDRCGRA